MIARHLIRYAQKVARQTGFPVYTAYCSQQQGANFGERLANEVTKCFQKGHERLLIIGNDCLHLNSEILQDAAAKCKPQQAILGPAHDGGLYLIGLHREHYKAAAFASLDWESPQLTDSFQRYLASRGLESETLATYRDIDNAEALLRIIDELSESHLLRKFLCQTCELIRPPISTTLTSIYQGFWWTSIPGRAPPIYIPL